MVKSRDGDGFGLKGRAEWMTELNHTIWIGFNPFESGSDKSVLLANAALNYKTERAFEAVTLGPLACPSRSACRPKKVSKPNLKLKYILILLKIVEKGNCNCNSLRHLRVTEVGRYLWICNNSWVVFLEVIVICCKNYQNIRAKNYSYQFIKKLGSLNSTRFILKKLFTN